MSTETTADVPANNPTLMPPLQQYLEVCQRRFGSCISDLKQPLVVDGVQAEVSFHFVKFDPTTKEPKFGLLAKALAKHIVQYCLSAKTRADVRQRAGYDEDEGELFMIARDYFRKLADSGEVGELLLFFLLEAAMGAPQVVCKMELKTNSADEVKGTDGIHVKWDVSDNHLDVYLGEAKLYQDIGGAMTDALERAGREQGHTLKLNFRRRVGAARRWGLAPTPDGPRRRTPG